MKKSRYIPFNTYCVLLLAFLFISFKVFSADNDVIKKLTFKQLSTLNGLPTDEVQKVYQDKDGFIWFATRYGLCQYDGYQVTLFKSNLYTPGLFTNNNIYCLTEDNNHNLWIGTPEGLNVLNKETGKIRKYTIPNIAHNVVSCLLVTKDNNIWVGTDAGLCKYMPQTDTFVLYSGELTKNVLLNASIKTLMEDSQGDIWIGTWSAGLYRYAPASNRFYSYPQINQRNSAHVVYEDQQQNIWVGTWDEGLFMLQHPRDMKNVSWLNYRHYANNPSSLSDNIVYDIAEDLNTHTLWVGTRSGLSIMQHHTPGEFINYKQQKSPYRIASNEINSILRDRFGTMWIGSIGGGVLMTDTHKSMFNLYNLDVSPEDIPTNAVRALFVDADQNVWLGVGSYGLARQERATNRLVFYSRIPEFSEIATVPTVYAIIQRKRSGHIWFGTYDGGLYIYRKGEKVTQLLPNNCSYLRDGCVASLYEDSAGNCWVGTRNGLGVSFADGSSHAFTKMLCQGVDLEKCYVKDIVQHTDGTIWLATANYGIIHIKGDARHPETLTYEYYNLLNQKLMTNAALCVYLDTSGRLWIGTEGSGLYLYDEKKNTFIEKNRHFNLPGDMVGSIEEDKQGNLWLGTNVGLVKLSAPTNLTDATTRVYTSADGLQDNFFIPQSSFSNGDELFFGGYKGYNSFVPTEMDEQMPTVPFFITDIKIFNRSFASLTPDVQKRISKTMPAFTQQIELPHEYNNFNIEFASLTYQSPELNKYAYRLQGFDKEWQYTDATRRFAYYNNLKSGTYTFQLKATNGNGVWSNSIREVIVIVYPPFWATWWAYIIYIVWAAVILFFISRAAKNRLLLKNKLQLREMEKSKADELNHAKLQFFTNITHELLTPLTIISATLDELKVQAPHHDDLYGVMNSNIRRLIRLLQQILEFRKAETGNLKLRVSPGDLVTFVKNEAESFRPLVKKKKIHFSIICDPESIIGYFDTDKLDKILYNLFSNAAKYNNEGGYIQVNLSYATDTNFVLLTVKDNGKGISKENQKTLFKRFYEGDYRKFNTIGTGIGLSLTKNLVELHGGSIEIESELNQGTLFTVLLPIERSYFKEEEIDEEVILPAHQEVVYEETEVPQPLEPAKERIHSLLVMEDNEDLLQLMVRLLSRDYKVFTAENGKEGIVVIENEDIDLVVSDIMMPQMDGIEFCNYVKSKLEYSHIPVILLTAKSKEEDRAQAYESGADAFLSKPFNLTVLHARIRNLLKYKERMAHDFKNQLVFEVKELNYTSIDEEFMQRAIDCVNRYLDDPEFDQLQFIEEMGTSKSTLYKKLKSLTGLNTSGFIRNIRLKAACRIMEKKSTSIRISELAYAVGFNDPKYFSACFKKDFGMLPSEYIELFATGKSESEEMREKK